MHEYADGHNDGFHASEHSNLRHVPFDGKSDGGISYLCGYGRVDSDALCAINHSPLGPW